VYQINEDITSYESRSLLHTNTHTHIHKYIYISYIYIYIPPVVLRPNSRTWTPLTGLCYHTKWTHHTPWESSGQMISYTQKSSPDNRQQSQKKQDHAPGGIRTHKPSRREAVEPRIRPRGDWKRHF